MRKRFHELSRSQKNRRLKALRQRFIIETDDPNNNVQAVEPESEPTETIEPGPAKLHSQPIYNNNDAISDTEYNNYDDREQHQDILRQQLAKWALLFNITHTALNNLLRILKEGGLHDLPLDARTLLFTPTKTDIIQMHPSGSYFHYGLENSLRDQLRLMGTKYTDTSISININIDGLPLSKSTNSQLWPILGEIFPRVCEPFVIGAYHGRTKPASVQEFLETFINEFKKLQNDGFVYLNRKYSVSLRAIICDSPARAFVTATKGHNAYFGCNKCTVEGDYRNHRMLFLELDAPLRTDEDFVNRVDEDHHIGNSPFQAAGVAMVTQFPLDYMHLSCLGVTKKLILLWKRGHHRARLSAAKINELSQDLIALTEWIPAEFQRKPRGIDEVDRWKATEFRLFLIYLGIVLVGKYMPESYALNFYALNCAMRILSHSEDCVRNNKFAEELLIYFVDECKDLYGEECAIFNIHSMIHLPRDAAKFGPIDSFSAFSFENFMQKVKKRIRKGEKTLSQLHRRIVEEKNCNSTVLRTLTMEEPILVRKNKKQLLMECSASYDKLMFPNFVISILKKADSYCYLRNSNIMLVTFIGKRNNKPILIGKVLRNPKNFPNYPCVSSNVGIFIGNEWSNLQMVESKNVVAKAMALPFNGSMCFLSLLH